LARLPTPLCWSPWRGKPREQARAWRPSGRHVCSNASVVYGVLAVGRAKGNRVKPSRRPTVGWIRVTCEVGGSGPMRRD
jgi:hypothetical protein